MRPLLLVFSFGILLAASASAQCPGTVGAFSSNDGGPVLNGRVSEAWCAGAPGQPGNLENAYSWDGAVLGTQWHVWDMAIDAAGATLIADNVDGYGNGTRTYQTFYAGGQFFLAGTGPWGDGGDLTGTLTSFVVYTTITFVAGQQVGASSNISFAGNFTSCPAPNLCRIEFAIANACRVWMSGGGDMPAGYPALLCGADLGELWDTCCMTIYIDCLVPTEDASWGAIKGLYRPAR